MPQRKEPALPETGEQAVKGVESVNRCPGMFVISAPDWGSVMGAYLAVLEDNRAAVAPLAGVLPVKIRRGCPGNASVRYPEFDNPLGAGLSPGTHDHPGMFTVWVKGCVNQAVEFLPVGGKERLTDRFRLALWRQRVE